MKHLGGNGTCMDYVEWLLRDHFYGLPWCIALVDGHPGTKRLETFLSRSFQCSHMAYGLCLD